MSTFTLTVKEANLNHYSKTQRNADVYCECCGRGIGNRDTAIVADKKLIKQNDDGSKVFEFIAIPAKPKNFIERATTLVGKQWQKVIWGRDSVEWGSFIGSHCAKQLPKEFKVSQKRLAKAWAAAGYP